jgi:hypothetical protein
MASYSRRRIFALYIETGSSPPSFLFSGVEPGGVVLKTHLLLVPRLRIRGVVL